MPGYDFLHGVRVLEVAHLGPSSLGGYLADMGAEVIKVEGADGDALRSSGSPAVGSPTGVSLLHLRWNRGKQSVGLDLKSAAGAAIFRQLAEQADVVIEGMRAGVLERLGLGYDVLSAANPRVVFCSLSGLGRDGPYHSLGSHGPSFDAFGGLSSANPYDPDPDRDPDQEATVPVGMHAMGLYAALGTLSALIRARTTGKGALIEVTGAEAAAHWRPDGVDAVLNAAVVHARPGFLNEHGRQAFWPRLHRYATTDGRGVFFQALSPKFWTRFCTVVGRLDLEARYASATELAQADDDVHRELTALFLTRTFDRWIDVFRDHDVPGGPANSVHDLATDPHFLARNNIYEQTVPGVGAMRLTSTPVKTLEQPFVPDPAPDLGQDTDAVLSRLLGLSHAQLRELHATDVLIAPPVPPHERPTR